MEGSVALVRIPLDRLPHDQVVGAQILVCQVRRPELVDRLVVEMEEDGRGDRPALVPRQNNETHPLRQHALEYAAKKSPRLRGKTVLLPGLAVQRIISLHRVEGSGNFELNLRAFRLA